MDIDTKKRLLSSFAAAEEFIQGKAGKMGDVMKKKTGIFYMTVCVFGISLAVCGIQADGRQNTSESQEEIQEETQKTVTRAPSDNKELMADALRRSYYEGQDKRAFGMFQKNIFKKLINDWTCRNLKNAVWSYDSFAAYQMLDGDGNSLSDKELYYCTYCADEGQCGYIVLAYDGGGLQRTSSAETSYPYDLDSNMEAVLAGLEANGIAPASARAARVGLTVGDNIQEAIRITDGEGHECICYFGKEGVSFEGSSGF